MVLVILFVTENADIHKIISFKRCCPFTHLYNSILFGTQPKIDFRLFILTKLVKQNEQFESRPQLSPFDFNGPEVPKCLLIKYDLFCHWLADIVACSLLACRRGRVC